MGNLTDWDSTELRNTLESNSQILFESELFRTHGGQLLKDGNQWCAIVGDLPEPSCIVGFGDSPYLAICEWRNAFFAPINRPGRG